MKVAFILLIAAVGALGQEQKVYTIPPPTPCTSNAFVCFFRKIGHKIKHTAINVGSALKDVGKDFLHGAATKAIGFAKTAALAGVKTLQNAVNDLPVPGKRSTIEGVEAFIYTIVDELKNGYTEAVDDLIKVAIKMGKFQFMDSDVYQDIDDIIAKFESAVDESDVKVTKRSHKADAEVLEFMKKFSQAFKPKKQKILETLKKFGSMMKGHASTMWKAVADAATNLEKKMKISVDEAKSHSY